MKQKLVIIGNSIVNGFPFSRGRSFPGLIRATIKDGGCSFHSEVINKGVNGQTCAEMTARFDQDVLGHAPNGVFIMTGTNDFIYGEATPSDVFASLDAMAARAEEKGIVPVLLTPLQVDAELASNMWMVGLGIDYDKVNSMILQLRELICKGNRSYIDTCGLYREFTESGAGESPASTLPPAYVDGVHPTENGQKYLAQEILKWIESHKSTIKIT